MGWHYQSPSPPQWGGEGRDEVGKPLESPTSPNLSAPKGGEELWI
jgi:hypothetical protein